MVTPDRQLLTSENRDFVGQRARSRPAATPGRSKYGTVTDHPDLAAQFDVEANGGRTPDQIIAGTNQRLWWVCPVADDHRWVATGYNRLRNGSGCPACQGLQASVTNNLARYPKLAAEFDVERNGGRTPDQIIANTHEKLWWACPVASDHRWQAPGNTRVSKRSGCPACAGLQVSVTNNLARYPKLAIEFDVERNSGRIPDQIVASTHKQLWWACPVASDHRWQASGANRVKGRGCPACVGRQVSVTNSLARYPKLAAEFDVERNGGRTPDQVVAGTRERLWWVCPVAPDHRWAAKGDHRLRARSGCPACAGKQPSVTNSLLNHPKLAAEFDVERNGGRTPDQVVAGTGERLWWACPVAQDHRWRTSGNARVSNGTGCPACEGMQVSVTNSLARYPKLAAEFDVERNGGRTSDQIVAGSSKKLWWICSVAPDHRWAATVSSRVRLGAGCPDCALVAVSMREIRLAAELAALLSGLDVHDHRLEVAGRRALNVDILDRSRLLAIEYDGSYWHDGEKRERRDRNKTTWLTEAGYTVIRVREAPLRPITEADVTVRPTEPIHAVTGAVLDRLAELRPDLLSAAEAVGYRLGGRELATRAAEARLADLRAEIARQRAQAGDSAGPPQPPEEEAA